MFSSYYIERQLQNFPNSLIGHSFLFFVIAVTFIVGCTISADQSYKSEIEKWSSDRFDKITAPDGWTTVIGLYWLREGLQYFGSNKEVNEIAWPKGVPSTIGKFNLEGDSVVLSVYRNLGVTIDGEQITKKRMISDVEGKPTLVQWKSYSWHLIKRQDKYGIRLKDTLNPARFTLEEIPRFPVKPKWNVRAKFTKSLPGQTVKYNNIVGMSFDNPVKGLLSFEYKGKDFELVALDGGEKEYFVIISDETTGNETYGGGRYLYPKIAGEDDYTQLDFNKAINPPCVFTDFATCPLPPKENHLPFAVKAGEKLPENFIDNPGDGKHD